MGQMIVEDLIDSWQHILLALVIAMVCCLIFIAMMRWLATPLVWISIVGVIGILGFCKITNANTSDDPSIQNVYLQARITAQQNT